MISPDLLLGTMDLLGDRVFTGLLGPLVGVVLELPLVGEVGLVDGTETTLLGVEEPGLEETIEDDRTLGMVEESVEGTLDETTVDWDEGATTGVTAEAIADDG